MRILGAHPFMRSTLSGVAITTISLGLLTAPAQATDATVSDVGALQTAASSCTDGDTVTLGADITATGATITTGCGMTLDLAGKSLSVAGVVITPGSTLTITGGPDGTGTLSAAATGYGKAAIATAGASLVIDSGTINATGPQREDSTGAGIGGSSVNAAGGTVTINGGTVNAVGGDMSAGIGGAPGGGGGTVTINGGTVTATGAHTAVGFSTSGAGIGGGVQGDGADVMISGGTVTVTGGTFAAGIGGGNGGTGGPVTIGAGAHVTAIGGMNGAGIGGGPFSGGGALTIDDGADVTAAGGQRQEGGLDLSAIGGGNPHDGPQTSFGSLTVSGTLRIPASANLALPADASVEVTSNGLITGAAEDADGGQIYGPGTIDNAGSIDLSDGKVLEATTPAAITDHHYAVSFDTQGGSAASAPVTVFAASFADGGRAFPDAPAKAGLEFTGWNSKADGSGVQIDADSTLPGSATDGPLALTAFAQYGAPEITGLAPTITGTAREGKTLTAHPGPVLPDDAVLSYRWLANGHTITGADGASLKLAKRQAARRISVRITATVPGRPAVVKTSAPTGYVSSSSRRLVLTDYTIEHRATFVVAATGLRSGQHVVIWLGGRKAYSGKADSTGTVHHTVRFASAIKPGTRRVRVSGYQRNGKRDYTIYTHVTYKR